MRKIFFTGDWKLKGNPSKSGSCLEGNNSLTRDKLIQRGWSGDAKVTCCLRYSCCEPDDNTFNHLLEMSVME
ncbi:hypothetical protein FCM35_KLT16700 [Carex littledalei]|uniref:Uncharacterized protein n=1 Tax=Carex littledalei TaxID=544730 RepID=A0A833RTK2_9POAL|nr:hypothetical protein FCM35_KLT16700 [Carex littledalei]